MYSEVKSRTLADEVVSNLLNYIHRSNLVPGDAMPKEEELAVKLNVSRHIIREGVSKLKAYGLIESRKRRGAVISRPDVFAGMRTLADAKLFSKKEWFDFLSMRIVMEIGMADMVYARATDGDIAELRELAGASVIEKSKKEEIDFHRKLFSIGGNFMASRFIEVLNNSFEYIFPEELCAQGNEKTHKDICDVLEHGSKEEFTAVLKTHFQSYTDLMINTKGGELIGSMPLKEKK